MPHANDTQNQVQDCVCSEISKVNKKGKENKLPAAKAARSLPCGPVPDLIYEFDNLPLGPKIGLSRRDRLARADLLGFLVRQSAREMINADDFVGDHRYTDSVGLR